MSARRPFPLPTRRYPPRELPPPRRRYRVRRDARAIAGFAILAVVLAGVVLAPWLSGYDPLAINTGEQFQGPSREHPFGTDLLGRDVFSRTLHGGRLTLITGIVAVLIAALPGTLLGLIAGYFVKYVDVVIMRVMDMLLSFPGILLALTIVAMLGPSLLNTMVAVGVSAVPIYTRVVRGNVLVLRRALFVRAARSVGAGRTRVIVRHILPNVMNSLVVLLTVDVAWAILSASSLSFLGLGVQPPAPEWGAMLNEGRGYLRQAPWVTLAPGLALVATILAINLLGDSLRDALDPRMQTR